MRGEGHATEAGVGAQREPAPAPAPAPAVAAAVPVTAMMQIGGNRATASLLGAAAPAPPVAIGRPASASLSLDDPSFNASTRAHDLIRAIDSAEHTLRLKATGDGFGQEEDVEAERRKVDFPVAVGALDGLTASQVKRVEELFLEFDKNTLESALFGGGESGRKADLTDDQAARLKALRQGTKPEPVPPDVLAQLRTYPPEIAGPLLADIRTRADAGPALARHQADAAELHELLSKELDEARRERVMAMHRRPASEIDAVDASYDQAYGAGVLARDLNLRLDGLQRARMAELRAGNTAQADACAIEDKRRRIEELDRPQEAPLGYDLLAEQRRKEKQELTQGIQSIVELNRREALADPANAGRTAGEAVADRLRAITGQQDGAAGTTLGSELARTLDKEDAAAIGAATDPWSTGTSGLVRAAAAELAADEKNGTTSAKKITATLRSFRELAQHDVAAQAYDPRVPAERKQALLHDSDGAVTRLAQRYIDEYKAEYNKLAGGRGRGYDDIVASADSADERLIGNLSYGGGRTSDLGELDHAVAKEDLGAVKEILRRQPGREKIDELVAGYQTLHPGTDLRRVLFGSDLNGGVAGPELAQLGSSLMVRGGLATGRDAAQVAEQLTKPTEAELGGQGDGRAAEARWITKGGLTEYGVTMDNRGVTGRARELTGDPETERLLRKTRDDLAAMARQFEAEADPARRGRLLAEMRGLRATLTGDADAYEKDNERVLGEIRSAVSFAVSIALAVAIPGAGPGIVAFLQTTAVNIAANVAANFVIKMGDYSLSDLKADVLGGALGAGGAKFGEELMGRVAVAVFKPAAEATVETAGRLGVRTALTVEAGSLAAATGKAAIRAEEFEIRVAGREAAETVTERAGKTIWETGAREAGGFFGGMYAPKVLTGDYGLSVEEVLKALAATAAGKIAHRQPAGGPAERAGPEEPPTRGPAEEKTPATVREEMPAAVSFVPEPAPPGADVFGPRSPSRMLLENGIPSGSAQGFQQVCDVFDIVITVRPTNTASLPVLEAGGLPKPELIKAKTVNRTDTLIGGPRDGLGKVGFFEPRMPSGQILDVMSPEARQAVEDRYHQRLDEYEHYKKEYGDLVADGLLRMRDGVLQIADPTAPGGQFKDIGGDHDLFAITNADGSPLDPDVRRGVINQLRSMGVHVEHGDHVSWPVDSPGTFDEGAYDKIYRQHATSEPLVAFVPKAQPREVMAGDVVTAPARTEGRGDRFLPARSGEATGQHQPAGPHSDETDFSVEPRRATPEEIAAASQERASLMVPGKVGTPGPDQKAGAADHRAAADLVAVRELWPKWSPDERSARLVQAISLQLEHTGAPVPRVTAGETENSSFKPGQWLIELGHPALYDPDPPIASFAEACDHARHEWEHVVLEFRVIRREAVLGGETPGVLRRRLKVARVALDRALEVNRDGGYETIDGESAAQADAIQESTRGIGAGDRADIMARLIQADRALAAAKAKGPGHEDEVAKAAAAYREAHREYAALPDEALAWPAGRRMHEAVRRRLELTAEFKRTLAAIERMEGDMENAAGYQRARLERDVDKARRDLKTLERRLAGLAGDDT